MKNISRELNAIVKKLVANNDIANEAKEYNYFTGEIDYEGNKGLVKDAKFKLYLGAIEWNGGTWKDGRWYAGNWEGGTWKLGKDKRGVKRTDSPDNWY